MKLLRLAIFLTLSGLATAQMVQIQVRLSYDDGSPLRAGTSDGNAGLSTPAGPRRYKPECARQGTAKCSITRTQRSMR